MCHCLLVLTLHHHTQCCRLLLLVVFFIWKQRASEFWEAIVIQRSLIADIRLFPGHTHRWSLRSRRRSRVSLTRLRSELHCVRPAVPAPHPNAVQPSRLQRSPHSQYDSMSLCHSFLSYVLGVRTMFWQIVSLNSIWRTFECSSNCIELLRRYPPQPVGPLAVWGFWCHLE